jgi:hypothetical protein
MNCKEFGRKQSWPITGFTQKELKILLWRTDPFLSSDSVNDDGFGTTAR